MQSETDASLVRQARSGSKQAFGELITRHQRMVQRVAYHMVRDDELALDLAQEALLAAYLSLENLRDETKFASWLYGIALNICRSHLREPGGAALSFEELVGGVAFETYAFSSEPDPQTLVELRELHERVLDAIQALSPENRTATLLFYYDGLTLNEISDILKIPVSSVKGRLYKSRARLRYELLSVYAEYVQRETGQARRAQMIPVEIADVVYLERKVDDKHTVPNHIIVLYDAKGQRALPIWVGPFEGDAITLGFLGEPTLRPMTYEFIVKLLEAVGGHVESVCVNSLQEDVFYATVTLTHGTERHEIDTRPSDALALAVRTKSPIYVSETVLDKAGIAVPQPAEIYAPPRGIEQMMQLRQSEFERWKTRPQLAQEDWEKSKRELVDLVFGK